MLRESPVYVCKWDYTIIVCNLLNCPSDERLFNNKKKNKLYDFKGGNIWRVNFSVRVEWFETSKVIFLSFLIEYILYVEC